MLQLLTEIKKLLRNENLIK